MPSDPSAKRDEILAGVWSVVAGDGVAAVSFRSVARAAGVSVGRVQHYYGDRATLLRASVERLFDLAGEQSPEALEGDAATRLRALLAHPIPSAAEHRPGASIFFGYLAAGVADPAIGELLADAKRSVRDEVAGCLRELGAAEPAPRARELCVIADGALMAVFLGTLDAASALDIIEASIGLALDAAGGTARA